MSFYYEWEAKHRQAEVLRETQRRAGWNLERGRLNPGEGFWTALTKLLGAKGQPAPVSASAQVTPIAREAEPAPKDHRKAS